MLVPGYCSSLVCDPYIEIILNTMGVDHCPHTQIGHSPSVRHSLDCMGHCGMLTVHPLSIITVDLNPVNLISPHSISDS